MGRKLATLVVVLLGAAAVWFATHRAPPSEAPEASAAPQSTPTGPTHRATSTHPNLAPGTVAGTVVSADGVPLAGASVVLRPISAPAVPGARPDDEPQHVRSDAGGRWGFVDLVAGTYEVAAVAAEHLPASLRPIELGGDTELTEIVLRLEPGGEALVGTVADALGGTVAGAIVTATGRSPGHARTAFATMTGPDGQYALHLRPGRHWISVRHPDYAPHGRAVHLSRGPKTEDFRLVPAGSIEGVVRRLADGAPLAGATVVGGGTGSFREGSGVRRRGGGLRTVANDQGRFRIAGLPPGTVHLDAFSDRHASRTTTDVMLGVAQSVSGIEIWVDEASRVSGVVAWSDSGEPVQGARVKLTQKSPATILVSPKATAADGRFAVPGVFAGVYEVTGHGDAVAFGTPSTIEVGADDVSEVRVLVERGTTLRGRVEPASEVEVTATLAEDTLSIFAGSKRRYARTTTAADGTFELTGLPDGAFDVRAVSADGQRGAATVVLPSPDTVVVDLVLSATISGHVRDDAGTGVHDIRVCARPNRETRRSLPEGALALACAHSGDDGSFTIPGLMGGTYEFDLRDSRFRRDLPLLEQSDSEAEVPDRGELEDVALVIAAQDRVIEGTVVERGGEPLTDAWVTVARQEPDQTSPDGTVRKGRRGLAGHPYAVDTDGHFTIEGLAEGEYFIAAQARGGTLRAEVIAEAGTTIVLEAVGVATITGTVVAETPPKQFTISARGPTSASRTFADEGGTFVVSHLTPGRYTVVAEAAGLVGSATVDLAPDAEVTVTVELDAQATITGRAVDADGAPLAGMAVRVRPADGGDAPGKAIFFAPVKTDASGRFEVTDVTPGGGRISITDPARGTARDHRSGSKSYEVEAGATLDVGDVAIESFADMTSQIYQDRSADLGLRFFVGDAAPTAKDLAALDADPSLMGEHIRNPDAKLWIAEVDAGGFGESAGFEVGDRVVAVGRSKIDGNAFIQVTSLARAWRSKGRPVTWQIERDGKPLDVVVLVPH
ncbi:MAG: carboxypeptidase regulatory-like domain-containing protein [Myxococcota bacterium]